MLIKMLMYLLCLGDNPLDHEKRSPADTMASDWEKVGMDIRKALGGYVNV